MTNFILASDSTCDSTSTLSSQSRMKCSYVTDESFMKLGNLQSRFNLKASHDLFIPSGRAKCAIHRWATDRKVTTERHVYFCNDCNINVCIDCHRLLKSEENMIDLKPSLCKEFMKENEIKMKDKKKIKKLQVGSIVSV